VSAKLINVMQMYCRHSFTAKWAKVINILS